MTLQARDRRRPILEAVVAALLVLCVERRCPGAFKPLQPIMSTREPLFVNHFRVQRDEVCLRGLVTDAAGHSGPR